MSKIMPERLARSAFVYVRQSTAYQVVNNLASQRRQYDRKSWNADDCEGARCRREHPVGDLINPPCGCRIRRWRMPLCS